MKHVAADFYPGTNNRLRASYVTVIAGVRLRRVSLRWPLSRLGPLEESRRLSQRRPCVMHVLQDARGSSLTSEACTSGWLRNSRVYRV
jgi:hypothetical protein